MRRTKRRTRRKRGGGQMQLPFGGPMQLFYGGPKQMLYGGLVDKADPKALVLWEQCLNAHQGFKNLGEICGETVEHMWQPPSFLIKKGEVPVKYFYHILTAPNKSS